MSTESSPSYRVAVIGCGGRGRAHAPGLLADPRMKVVALADARIESADSYNADYGFGAALYADYAEMLCREKPEVVVLTLWTDLHLPVLKDCIAAGVKAVLSEKPMAGTWNDTQEIAKLAEDSGILLTFCHQRRFASGNRKVRELLDAGMFGTIERMDLFSPPHLLDCGTHSVDQAMSFNKENDVVWVHGAADLSTTVNYFNVRAEGMFTGIFHFANGVHATIRTGRQDMDIWGGVRVTGSDGFVEVMWDGQIKRAVLYSDPAWKFPDFEEKPEEQMIGVIQNALDCLESGAEPELSYKKAIHAAEVLFALYESSKRREKVTLPLEGVTGNPLFDLLDTTQKPKEATS